jgi:hypothetical protein
VSVGHSVYVVGGIRNTRDFASDNHLFVGETHTKLPCMLLPVHNFAVCVFNEKIYVFGGQTPSGKCVHRTQIFDTDHRTWFFGPNLPVILCDQHCKFQAFVHQGQIALYQLRSGRHAFLDENDQWSNVKQCVSWPSDYQQIYAMLMV